MQGIILTGGQGSRLMPLTKHTNKHLLDVCGRPMVYYSLSIFISAGVTDVTLVTNPEHVEAFDKAITGAFRDQFTPLRIIAQKGKPGIAGSIQMMPKECRVGPYLVVLGDNMIVVPIVLLYTGKESIAVAKRRICHLAIGSNGGFLPPLG